MSHSISFIFEHDYTYSLRSWIPEHGVTIRNLPLVPRSGDYVHPSIFQSLLSQREYEEFYEHVEVERGLVVKALKHLDVSETMYGLVVELVTHAHYQREKNLEFLSNFAKAMDVYDETRKRSE